MTADGANIFLLNAGFLDHGIGGVGEEFPERHVCLAQTIDFIGTGVHQCMDLASGIGWNRIFMGANENGLTLLRHGNQHGINPVDAGSRHQADVMHDLSFGELAGSYKGLSGSRLATICPPRLIRSSRALHVSAMRAKSSRYSWAIGEDPGNG